MSSIAPGWYKDPADPATQRYWDGEGWLGDAAAGRRDAAGRPAAGRRRRRRRAAAGRRRRTRRPAARRPPPPGAAPPASRGPAARPPARQPGRPPPAAAAPPGRPPPGRRRRRCRDAPPGPALPGDRLRRCRPPDAAAARPRAGRARRPAGRPADRHRSPCSAEHRGQRLVRLPVRHEITCRTARSSARGCDAGESDRRTSQASPSAAHLLIVDHRAGHRAVVRLRGARPRQHRPDPRQAAVRHQGGAAGERRPARLRPLDPPLEHLGLPTLLWTCYGLGFVLQFVDCLSPPFDRPLHQALHDKARA